MASGTRRTGEFPRGEETEDTGEASTTPTGDKSAPPRDKHGRYLPKNKTPPKEDPPPDDTVPPKDDPPPPPKGKDKTPPDNDPSDHSSNDGYLPPRRNRRESRDKRTTSKTPHTVATKRTWAPNYKLSSIPKLSGSENYRTWRDISEYVLRLFNCWNIVLGTEEIPEEEIDGDGDVINEDPIDGFQNRYQYASAYFLETIEPQWLILLATHKTPSAIWQAFEDKFARENTSSFFDQLNTVFDTRYDTATPIAEHINAYDTYWNRIQLRCSAATPYDRYALPFVFKSVFESPEAKAAILLRSLPESMNNIVDNLQTKEDLTYDHVYNKLMDLRSPTSGNSEGDKAYKTAIVKGKGREQQRSGRSATPKECTYCKKHYPSARSEGHAWNECSKLKADNQKKKNEKKAGSSARIVVEETSPTVSTSSRTYTTEKSLDPKWVIDTGASSHMTNNLDLLINFQPEKGTVRLGDDSVIESCGRGTVKILAKTSDGQVTPVYLQRVLWVPELGCCSLLSWRAIVSLGKGFSLRSSGGDMNVLRENKTEVIWGKLEDQEYVVQEEKELARKMTYQDWHEALGHPSPNYLKNDNYSNTPTIPSIPKDWQCETCITSKSTKRTPEPNTKRCDTPFELIHSDLSGKFSQQSFGNSWYYITFIDDCTRYAWIYHINAKSDTVKVFTQFILERQTQDNAVIKRFRTDNGGEYVNKDMLTLFQKHGILHDRSPPYSHESNGVAERYNRTIVTSLRSMLNSLTLKLWAEAVATAVYLRNRLPNRSIGNSTPYESLYKQKPSIHHVRPYGTKCFVHIPEEARKAGTKLLPRAIEGYLVGYTSSDKIYRIYIPSQHKISETRQIHWTNKTIIPLAPTHMESSTEKESFATVTPLSHPPATNPIDKLLDQDYTSTTTTTTTSKELSTLPPPIPDRPSSPSSQLLREQLQQQLDVTEPLPDNEGPRKSGRITRPPAHFGRNAKKIPDEDPTTYRQAINSSLRDQWTSAMDDEIAALKKNNTFEVVDKPIGRNIIDSKWVFKTKKNADGTLERYRARAVAKGYSQVPGFDFEDTFAPVIRYESLRFLLAICAKNKWRPRQFDVKSAFLYGELKEEVYMRPPSGFSDGDKVWKLNRCLYGLKQSANEWYALFARFLTTKGFTASTFDPCMFVHAKHDCYISLYVDDIAIYSADNPYLKSLIKDLKTAFEITDLGEASFLLGLHITYTPDRLRLTQERYIDTVLKRFDMENSRTVSTPLPKGIQLKSGTEDERIPDPSIYQSIIGSLMYVTTGTRPDLSYTISFLSQFSACPTEQHLKAAKHVLKYLNHTKTIGLDFPYRNTKAIDVYVDADYAACLDSRRSYSGYTVLFNGSCISWCSKKQKSVSVSTTEAEYVAMSLATRQIQWLTFGLHDVRLDMPIAMHADNTGANFLARNPQLNVRTKHIDVHFHKTREELQRGTFTLLQVASQDNLADICTKILAKPAHELLMDRLGCR